eukprot:TRINITY_DN628_c0_g1_i4.p1 TRINITY_DN628_c0_g1~~TRINITY_DN628_c0_g1_i4.p1  ORF type:complete len:348 (+),score=66.10 TRINITY_DN628_c0_g1_i4:1449-2492(+)
MAKSSRNQCLNTWIFKTSSNQSFRIVDAVLNRLLTKLILFLPAGWEQTLNSLTRITTNALDFESLKKLAKLQFKHAVDLGEKKEYEKAISFLNKALQNVHAARFSGRSFFDQKDVIKVLEEGCEVQLCTAMDITLRITDLEFQKAINDEFNTEVMWSLVDLYKSAILDCRNKDTETEAICCSRIGRIFTKVFKIDEKAHAYYKISLELALSLAPKSFENVDWFQEVKAFLQDYQTRKTRTQDEEVEKQNEQFQVELKDVIEELEREKEKGLKEFLIVIHEKYHPNADADWKYEEGTDLKKLTLKAIVLYHPDKQKAVTDNKTKYLYGIIVRHLNGLYEKYYKCHHAH